MITQGCITVYNKKLGPDRMDIYVPTRISAASYAESRGSIHKAKDTEETLDYMLRIPVGADIQDGRRYAPEDVYRRTSDVSDLWTLSQLDLVTLGEPVVTGPSTEREIKEAAAAAGVDVITIQEYADNTHRGSRLVQHWRIGGR